jgi:hypothetical protein
MDIDCWVPIQSSQIHDSSQNCYLGWQTLVDFIYDIDIIEDQLVVILHFHFTFKQ